MSQETEVANAAQSLATKDEKSLELLLGMRQKAIENDPSLKSTVDLEVQYDESTMGFLDDVQSLGRRVLKRWNKELNQLVCGSGTGDKKDREAILRSLNLGEAAVISAVAAALLGLGVPPPIAVVVAPLITKKFIWPAKDELCEAWSESIKAEG